MHRYNLWEQIVVGLEHDERVIFPQMYLNHPELYDRVCGIAYLVRSKTDPDSGLDWAWERQLGEIQKRKDLEVLAKQYIVRVKLPWEEVDTQFLVDQNDLNENRADYDILDVFLTVRRKSDGKVIHLIAPLVFESEREEYEVVEAKYLVSWKWTPEEIDRFVKIPGDRFHTVPAE